MSRHSTALAVMVILLVAGAMRMAWLRADPPLVGASNGVGVVWHDEGAWVHNARNKALWGQWRTDEWNPVFIAPVFTALEYGAFELLGVGTWQARTVSVAAGLVAVCALMIGLARLAGARAALIGGAMLATNYGFVMWNRAALMESAMTAAIVCAWAAYAWSDRRPWWGAIAGVAATIAWFTKAASAFFIGALVIDIALSLVAKHPQPQQHQQHPQQAAYAVALWTIGGLAASTLVVAVIFVLPHWNEYQFYNWQMSIERKPSYGWRDLKERASWLPFVQGIFSQMFLVAVVGLGSVPGIAARWRTTSRGARLLALWVLVGFAELVIHDSGNERRYVMFIPALVALAALAFERLESRAGRPLEASWEERLTVFGTLLVTGYVAIGTLLRPFFLDAVLAGDFRTVVRLTGGLTLVLALLGTWWLPKTSRPRTPFRFAGLASAAVAIVASTTYYAQWAEHRTFANYDASIAIGRILPANTLIQGKLANGLSLENRIHPLFVGKGFGNYDDRLRRSDARYILTYGLPSIGYESQNKSGLIQEILDRYPAHRTIASLLVDETPEPDRALLIDKFPDGQTTHAPD